MQEMIEMKRNGIKVISCIRSNSGLTFVPRDSSQQPVRQVYDLDAVVISYGEPIAGQDDFLIVIPDL